jgi:hypothetical protein
MSAGELKHINNDGLLFKDDSINNQMLLMANKIYNYLKRYPVTFVALILYYILWCSLFTPFAIVIGEWPVGPIVALPFLVLILLNLIFRKGHRTFYFIITVIAILPFLLLVLSLSC